MISSHKSPSIPLCQMGKSACSPLSTVPMRGAAVLLLALAIGCESNQVVVPAGTSPKVQVEDTSTAVVLHTAAAQLQIDKATAQLTLRDQAGHTLTQSASPPTLVGSVDSPLLAVADVQPLMRDGAVRGVALTCRTAAGPTTWRIEALTARAIATRVRPQDPSSVTRVIISLQATADEHYYGLTERIVDARNSSEIAPQAVGSLDRRGERVTMAVTPTMALYAPLLHSSRGYATYVEGTMPGQYDIAKSDPQVVTIDFELSAAHRRAWGRLLRRRLRHGLG